MSFKDIWIETRIDRDTNGYKYDPNTIDKIFTKPRYVLTSKCARIWNVVKYVDATETNQRF